MLSFWHPSKGGDLRFCGYPCTTLIIENGSAGFRGDLLEIQGPLPRRLLPFSMLSIPLRSFQTLCQTRQSSTMP